MVRVLAFTETDTISPFNLIFAAVESTIFSEYRIEMGVLISTKVAPSWGVLEMKVGMIFSTLSSDLHALNSNTKKENKNKFLYLLNIPKIINYLTEYKNFFRLTSFKKKLIPNP